MDRKSSVLRGLVSWIAQAVGIYVMFAVYGVLLWGLSFIPIALGMASLFMIGFLLYRLGDSFK